MKQLVKLSLLLLAFMLPATATAYDFEVDGIYYLKIGPNAIVTSSPSNNYYGDVVIPSTVTFDGWTYSVTAIGEKAFYNCSELTSVTIPNSVTSIGESAFWYCYNLYSVSIPNSVTYIGDGAFSDCSGLTSLTIPNSVTSIGERAFYGCSGLTSVTIPNSVTYINNFAFAGCSGLTSVTIPNSVTYIDYWAFASCSGLTSLTIPNLVTHIGDCAFNGCSGLTSINIPNSVTYIGNSAFGSCYGLTSITIPNSVIFIGDYAFQYCRSLNNVYSLITDLSTVTMGSSVFRRSPTNYAVRTLYVPAGTSADYQANTKWSQYFGSIVEFQQESIISFADANVKMICVQNWDTNGDGELSKAEAAAATNLGSVFYNNNTITSFDELQYFTGLESIGNGTFYGCSGLTSVLIPDSVTSIGEMAFFDCEGLTSVSIPSSVTSIGNSAFFGCIGLTSVTIGNSVTSIGNSAFGSCYGLTSITIPNSVISIGNEAFEYCFGLTSVTIGNSVTSIGEYAFGGCGSLTSMTIPNSVTYIGNYAFRNCNGLTNVSFGSSINSIGEFAFNGCSGLTSVTIGNSVTSIGVGAFSGCSLTSIIVETDNTIYDSRNNCNAIIESATNTLIAGCMNTTFPNSVSSIGNFAFFDCIGLISLAIPNSVTYIGNGAFSGCSGLLSVTIPNSVITIGKWAFENCTGLISFTFGNSVTSIGEAAFRICTNLTNVTCLATTPPTCYSDTDFSSFPNHVTSQATLYVPSRSLSSYIIADNWKDFYRIVGIPQIDDFEVNGIYYHALTDSTVLVISNPKEENYYQGDMMIPDSVTYQNFTFYVIGIDAGAFDGCDELNSVVIGNAVETIGEEAFQGCTGLTSVTIGNGVTSIGQRAFNYCNALQTVTCQGTVPPVMANSNCFSSAAYRKATLKVHRNYIDTYTATNYWYKFENIEGFGSVGLGDANGDGNINISDVTSLIDRLLGKDTDEFYFESADLNGNGHLDIGDVVTLIDLLLWSH